MPHYYLFKIIIIISITIDSSSDASKATEYKTNPLQTLNFSSIDNLSFTIVTDNPSGENLLHTSFLIASIERYLHFNSTVI